MKMNFGKFCLFAASGGFRFRAENLYNKCVLKQAIIAYTSI
ncbi:hypothetical protein DCCM_0427 [Desulfocucumis palustris]|uniref:Uncharacterized protein n=1 Tax=Desulfocucumis palustris TaxID=1898651 RepID=A0A2L2XDD1_9FIRM|nr:hypothetical protein DCCM_0427 [Desulfocucumis palustris]